MLSKYAKHVYIHTKLLTEQEINEIIKKYDHDESYDIRFNKKSYRKCDKQIIMDRKLAELVWSRIEEYVQEVTTTEGKTTWVPFC